MKEKPIVDSAQAKVVSLTAETRFAPNGIVSRTLLSGSTTRVVLFGFSEGQELSEHISTKQAMVQILSGECDFLLNGKSHLLKSGDLLYMPPNQPHAVRAITPFAMLLTLFKSETPAPAAAAAA